MPEAPLLRTEALTRAFGSLIAVDRVDVAVRRGELRSIIGPNGAGKTTFFRLISGETTPTSGRVWFGQREITGLPQHAVARLGITKSYQITNVFPHLSVHENVRVAVQGWTRSFNFWSRADALTDVPRTSPTARSATWRSPSRWPPSRSSCCSTSRRRA